LIEQVFRETHRSVSTGSDSDRVTRNEELFYATRD